MNTAKLFANGQSQAVRLPKEYRFDGTEVYIKKIGEMVIMFPKDKELDIFLSSLSEFSDDYMADGKLPDTPQQRESL
jgi:antitoxin VapB